MDFARAGSLNVKPRVCRIVKPALLAAAFLLLALPHFGQVGSTNSTPQIMDLRATPASIDSDSSSCMVSFTVFDPEGDYVSWEISLEAAGDDDLDGAGTLSSSSGTDESGAVVRVTYTAPSAWNPVNVVLTVTATDGHGGWAGPQWIAIPVAPGGLGRES